MVRRCELGDEAYRLIEHRLPAGGKTRRAVERPPDYAQRDLLILHTGAQWRELPERYGNWQSVYDRHDRWSRDGTINRMLARLQLKLDAEGRTD
jgi:transposase